MNEAEKKDIALIRVARRMDEGSDARDLRRAAQHGRALRVRRGMYVAREHWDDANDLARYLTRIRAVAETRMRPAICSHLSAAALWGIPIIGRWPDHVELLADGRPGVRTKNGVVWHHEPVRDDVAELDGLLVTSLERTLIDRAKASGFASAVASIDFGTKPTIDLRGPRSAGVPKESLLDRLRREGGRPGVKRAKAVIEFSDARSGSPGESLSRVQIRRLGFPAPRLQSRIERADGGADYPDFEWPTLFGEFDGYAKYTHAEYLGGRSTTEVVWEEKLREDRPRSTGKGMARWLWSDALVPEQLRTILLRAGLRQDCRR